MDKAHKRQRWLCTDPSRKNVFLVEVVRAGRDGRVDVKVVQVTKGTLVTVGQVLRDEMFSPEYDKYLEGQDAARD
jgi:hypothetical protein